MKLEINTDNPRILLVDGEAYIYKPEISCDDCALCDKDSILCDLCTINDLGDGGWTTKNTVVMPKKEIASKLGLSEQDLIILNDQP